MKEKFESKGSRVLSPVIFSILTFFVVISATLPFCQAQSLDLQGKPRLIIQGITYHRLPSVYQDKYGVVVSNGKNFSFRITVANIGSANFVGQISVWNTGSRYESYDRWRLLTRPETQVIIVIGDTASFSFSDFFYYHVDSVRFKLGAKSYNWLDTNSVVDDSLGVMEVSLPDQ